MLNRGFKPGDVVTLRSGGPHMTVEWVSEAVDCVWFPSFDAVQPQTRSFQPDVLMPVRSSDLDDAPGRDEEETL